MKKKVSNRKRFVFGICVILWMIVIFHYSNQPAVTSSELSGGICDTVVEKINDLFSRNWSKQTVQQIADRIEYPVRKAAHMSEYAILACLIYGFALTTDGNGFIWKRKYILTFLATACYAATDEFHQYFIPGRSAEVRDVMIDSCGAIIGLLILYTIRSCWRKKGQKKE